MKMANLDWLCLPRSDFLDDTVETQDDRIGMTQQLLVRQCDHHRAAEVENAVGVEVAEKSRNFAG